MGCEFTVQFAETGYSAVETVVNLLETGLIQIHKLEANDSEFSSFLSIGSIMDACHYAPVNLSPTFAGADLGGGCRGCAPLPLEMICGSLIQLVFCKIKLCGLLVLK